MNYLIRYLINNEENIQRNRMLRLEKRTLRDNSDPFNIPDRRFVELFRLNKDLVHFLHHRLLPHMDVGVRITRIPPMLRILSTLRFFATGSYQRSVSEEYLLSSSQQMISRFVVEVSQAILMQFSAEWIVFPVTPNSKLLNKAAFMDTYGFPGCIGAIDCTHISILAPVEEEHNYVNRKSFHSKNVQLVCNTNLEILNVNASYPGSTHDSFIWRSSTVKRHLEDTYNAGDTTFWLIGDSGYPQEPWLMTPIQDALPNSPEYRYNMCHARARSCIERCNGILKNRFRCLLGERKLRYHPEKVGLIVNVCCILHNMCVKAHIPVDNEELNMQDFPMQDQAINAELNNRGVAEGRRARENIINMYFRL